MFIKRILHQIIFKNSVKPQQIRQNSSGEKSSAVKGYFELWRKYPVPIWAGLTVIGLVQYRRIRKNHDEAVKEAVEAGKISKTSTTVTKWEIKAYNSLPLEALSRYDVISSLSKVVHTYCVERGWSFCKKALCSLQLFSKMSHCSFKRLMIHPLCSQ
jgi:hypothetical protein